MARGRFITLEGGDGAGKSTQIAALDAYLTAQGKRVVTTREVGGTLGAEDIRRLWLAKPHGFWDALSEVLLIMAARREHLIKVIWPELEDGAYVISDRFVDSTRAYQGIAQGLGVAKVDAVYREIAGDFWPDLTLVLDLPVEVGYARMQERRGASDRFEEQDKAFHETLRQAYLDFAKNEPNRFAVINANQPPEYVQQEIVQKVEWLV